MLVNNPFVKKKNINFPKLIALSAVGLVFVLVFSYSIWNQYWSDTLAKYVPAGSVFYAHFSIPTFKDSDLLNELIEYNLAAGGLSDFPFYCLDRELAIVGQPYEGQVSFYILVKTASALRLKSYLQQKGVKYHFFDSRRAAILIGKNQESMFSGSTGLAKRIRGKFSYFNSLSVFIDSDFFEYFSSNLFIDYFRYLTTDSAGDIYLNFRSKDDGLIVSAPGLINNFSGLDYNQSSRRFDFSFLLSNPLQDITVWFDNLQHLSPEDLSLSKYYQDRLKFNYGFDLENDFWRSLLSGKVFLAFNRTTNGGDWFFNDYDFVAVFDWPQSYDWDEGRSFIDSVLKSVFARQFPGVKNVSLSDGTAVYELAARPDDFTVYSQEDYYYLSSPDKVTSIFYKFTGSSLIISNKLDYLSFSGHLAEKNYLKIKTPWLNLGDMFGVLGLFDEVETGSTGLYLR